MLYNVYITVQDRIWSKKNQLVNPESFFSSGILFDPQDEK